MKYRLIYLTSLLILSQLCLYAYSQDSTSGQSRQSKVLFLPNATIGYKYIAALPLASTEGKVKLDIVAGQLPRGLEAEDIWIKGFPQLAGRFEFEILATDEIRQQSRQKFVIDVLWPPAKPLEIRHESLPDCISFIAYDQPLLVEGGYPPYSWRILYGELPNGLSFEDGRVIGTVRKVVLQPLKYEFSTEVKDSNDQIASQKFSLKLNPNSSINLKITPIGKLKPKLGKFVQLPESVVGRPYSITLAATGGVQPLKWEIEDGNLPDDISLNDNKLIGTPIRTGESKFSLSVNDGIGQKSRQDFLLRVLPQPAPTLKIIMKNLPDAYRTIPYEAVLQAEGGNPPYFWRINKDDLPDWAKLEKDRIFGISKENSSIRKFTFYVSITDNAGSKDGPIAVSLEVKENPMVPPPLEIVSQELPTAYRMVPYYSVFLVQGGYPPYVWTIDKDTLPIWLEFDAGSIIGLPKDISAIGQVKIKVNVRDKAGNEIGPEMISLEVKENPLIRSLRIKQDEDLPRAIIGEKYKLHFVASGGLSPYRFDYKSEIEWLSCEADGRIHGIPNISGKQSIGVSVTDADGQQDQQEFIINAIKFNETDLQVPEPFKITTLVDKPFQFKLPIAGGISPYHFSINEPLLKGLKFESSTGCFSGIPKEVGHWLFKVKVSNAFGKSSKAAVFELEVFRPPSEMVWYKNTVILIILLGSGILLVFYFSLLVIRTALRERSNKSATHSYSQDILYFGWI